MTQGKPPVNLLDELGFVLEERAGVWVVQEDAGGCYPANLTERVLWKALLEMHQQRQCLHKISEPADERGLIAFREVINYVCGAGRHEEPLEFLRCWNEGNFSALRKEWPDAPLAIYYADPLADHAAIDAALAQS